MNYLKQIQAQCSYIVKQIQVIFKNKQMQTYHN